MKKWKDINKGLPGSIGNYYEAEVPDTLDLAERAKLGINHFMSVTDEHNDYQSMWTGNKEAMWHGDYIYPICHPKMMEALALCRFMSGSKLGLSKEDKMIEHTMSLLGEEGLWWTPSDPDRFPWIGPKEFLPYIFPLGNIRMIHAMMAWYQYTGNPIWKKSIDRMVNALDNLVLKHKDDYAYVPIPPGDLGKDNLSHYILGAYVKGGTDWKNFVEPPGEKNVPGTENTVIAGVTAGILANWFGLTGNKQALRLSGEIVRFYTKPRFWADWDGGEYQGVVGSEHAHWNGHIHSYLDTLRGILEYAIATNDTALKQWVRDGYEWARQPTLARYGFLGDCQGCGCGRFVALAAKLTLAGVGDYWEDIDYYTRNILTEMQFTPDDMPGIEADKIFKKDGTGNTPYETMLGGFSRTPFKEDWAMCCSPHGNMGLFYAWYGTLLYENGVSIINLLLNRASPWLDMDSWLPYEGKVLIHNKKSKKIFIRVPLWADLKKVDFALNKKKITPYFQGRYAIIEGLKNKDEVLISIPLIEWKEKFTGPEPSTWGIPLKEIWWPQQAAKEPINFSIVANTIVDISKPILPGEPFKEAVWRTYMWRKPDGGKIPSLCDSPLFRGRKKKFTGKKAEMKKVERFVTEKNLVW